MAYEILNDKRELERFLKKDIYLHLYSLGDLDDFFWPYTKFYGLRQHGEISAVMLLYSDGNVPTVLGFFREPTVGITLAKEIKHVLPHHFHAHFSPRVQSAFNTTHTLNHHGEFCKMALTDMSVIQHLNSSDTYRLSNAEIKDILELYCESYPGNWFNPRMLDTGQYFGIRENGRIVSIAGIHVYSPRYKVAALGNITTLPSYRNRGLGKKVTAALCQSLNKEIDHIGLNVKANNTAAIACYKKLGFKVIATYNEFTVHKK
ncbi:MAG: GNAT family N-acetyltransferase [Candidatus Latescibacteria bacterium]|nr:GNAT family N-acetyltransferase [Candidatus Latescibacterota bacterium]